MKDVFKQVISVTCQGLIFLLLQFFFFLNNISVIHKQQQSYSGIRSPGMTILNLPMISVIIIIIIIIKNYYYYYYYYYYYLVHKSSCLEKYLISLLDIEKSLKFTTCLFLTSFCEVIFFAQENLVHPR